MEKLTSKCKNCGSELFFDAKKQVLACKYCEASYHLPKSKNDAVLVRGYSNSFHPNQLNKTLSCFQCEMCDYTYFTSSEENSQDCPNCGSASLKSVNSTGYCADGIITFEISKEHALKNLKSFLKSKASIPSHIKKGISADKLTGVFIPVWNFVFDIDVAYTANASDLRKDERGYYYSVPMPVYGEKRESIRSLDQCASSAEFDDFLELFDEKDYDKIIPYTPEYTYGFKVDNIDRNIHEYHDNIIDSEQANVKKTISNYVLNKYTDVRNLNVTTLVHDEYFNFVYVPVYIYKYTHKGKVYKIYISGTSGKVAGNIPKSIKSMFKILLKFLGLGAAIAIMSYFIFN